MFPVKDIMTKNLITIRSTDNIYDAMELLAGNRISGLPVVDEDNNLVGILSEWDVLHLLTDSNIDNNLKVEDYMSKNVVSFKAEDSAIDVCDFLKNSNKRRAPIVENGKIIGLISRHDIIKLILHVRKNMPHK